MPAMNPFVGVSATQPREAASFNTALDSTGLASVVGRWSSGWFIFSSPVSQLGRWAQQIKERPIISRSMKMITPLTTACLIASALYFTGCASRPKDASRSTLLSLPWQQFDQTPGSGWRIYGERKQYREAAELLEVYLKRHNELTVRQRAVSRYHAGIMRVRSGNSPAGITHLNQSIVPDKTPGLSDDWNDMVIATKAFLVGDRAALLAAKERVASLPPSSVEWPDYPGDLLKHFGEPYGSW
jgi:hypothetical protein